MNTDGPNAAGAAATEFGVRREAKRHAALAPIDNPGKASKSAVAAALCRRTPYLCRPCVELQPLGFAFRWSAHPMFGATITGSLSGLARIRISVKVANGWGMERC